MQIFTEPRKFTISTCSFIVDSYINKGILDSNQKNKNLKNSKRKNNFTLWLTKNKTRQNKTKFHINSV